MKQGAHTCRAGNWHWPMCTYTNRTFDRWAVLIWLTSGSWQPSTCQGQWFIDFCHNEETQTVWTLAEVSCGMPSNRILSEVSVFKALTCLSDIPADTVPYGLMNMQHLTFASSWWCWEREVFHRLFFPADLKRHHMLWNASPQCRNLFPFPSKVL